MSGSNIVPMRPQNREGGGGIGLPPGGGGPDDPLMEARIAALEQGFAATHASLARLEALQAGVITELRDLRRDLKEDGLPAVRASLAAVEAGLSSKPSTADFHRISSDMNRMIWTVFAFVLTLVAAVVGSAWVLRWIGLV